MALSIKHPEADRLARELAEKTGESITAAVVNALKERLSRYDQTRPRAIGLADEIIAISDHCGSLPVLDDRTPEEILGYDEKGAP
ncbi:MAG: antitoxin [Acidimicrobiia bacterium]|nr:antitoxin [Acidimicrobiia bacterium]